MKQLLFYIITLAAATAAHSQPIQQGSRKAKGFIYFGGGTNLSFYAPSNISVRSNAEPQFNFTLHGVRAKDDGGIRFGNGGAPQYSYQVGYYFVNKKFGLEFNFDHVKYFVRTGQVVRLKGTINNRSYDTDTALTNDFFQLEHSDGANYMLFSFVKWLPLHTTRSGGQPLHLMAKAGIGPVLPKTNSNIMGRHYDDQYKVSGYVVALEGGLRYNFLRHFYLAPSVKAAYANYNRFLIADGTGEQKWLGLHFMLVLGGQIGVK